MGQGSHSPTAWGVEKRREFAAGAPKLPEAHAGSIALHLLSAEHLSWAERADGGDGQRPDLRDLMPQQRPVSVVVPSLFQGLECSLSQMKPRGPWRVGHFPSYTDSPGMSQLGHSRSHLQGDDPTV